MLALQSLIALHQLHLLILSIKNAIFNDIREVGKSIAILIENVIANHISSSIQLQLTY